LSFESYRHSQRGFHRPDALKPSLSKRHRSSSTKVSLPTRSKTHAKPRSREEFETLLNRAKKSHGKAAKRLVTEKFRNQLAKVAKSDEFRATAEEVRKKLKSNTPDVFLWWD